MNHFNYVRGNIFIYLFIFINLDSSVFTTMSPKIKNTKTKTKLVKLIGSCGVVVNTVYVVFLLILHPHRHKL